MQFTDSHCHLDFIEFQHKYPQLLSQCQQNNINRIIVPSVNPEHWHRVLSLPAQAHSTQANSTVNISCCLGIHPWFIIIQDNLLNEKSAKNIDLAFNEQQLKQAVIKNINDIVAIGECGIDVFKAKKNTESEQALTNNLNLQQAFFEMQLHIANQNDLPVVIHHCQSHHLILPLLKKIKLNRTGVIHAFSGSYQQAKAYVDLGFKLGIGGTITYERSKKTINAVKRLPLSTLLLETDAPAMPPFGQQGLINTPLNLLTVFKALCIIRDEPEEIIAKQIESNVDELFFSR
ncbi:TatD family hydrolase [Candidatus Colwellia aromaticivorans]|uniref:TatD family hydrolase n=1 Tax=Candidatus Colwellia aromaticivorans TaxID=2267621 RepID=UPI000DF2ED7A|nr:TatD family hydrolase [Candidatus Colwellia aromaticivorans]